MESCCVINHFPASNSYRRLKLYIPLPMVNIELRLGKNDLEVSGISTARQEMNYK